MSVINDVIQRKSFSTDRPRAMSDASRDQESCDCSREEYQSDRRHLLRDLQTIE